MEDKVDKKEVEARRRLKDRWHRFDIGEKISTKELNQMLAESEEAERYCSARGFRGALFKIRMDIHTLMLYKFWRETK